jgi:hypothetical protein
MSGLLRSVVLASGRSIDALVPGDGGDPSSSSRSVELRRHGSEVVASPEEDEPAHAHVVGDKAKRSTRRLLADLALDGDPCQRDRSRELRLSTPRPLTNE